MISTKRQRRFDLSAELVARCVSLADELGCKAGLREADAARRSAAVEEDAPDASLDSGGTSL